MRLDPTTEHRAAPVDMYVAERRLPGGNKLQDGEICPKHASGNLWPQMNARLALTLAASFLFAGVFIGAFGAHVLEGKLAPDLMVAYQTAVQYHFWHALGLLAVAILLFHKPDYAPLVLSAWFMVVGLVLFCGSLYLMALIDLPGLAAVMPLGGVAFLAAWATLLWAALRW